MSNKKTQHYDPFSFSVLNNNANTKKCRTLLPPRRPLVTSCVPCQQRRTSSEYLWKGIGEQKLSSYVTNNDSSPVSSTILVTLPTNLVMSRWHYRGCRMEDLSAVQACIGSWGCTAAAAAVAAAGWKVRYRSRLRELRG